MSRPASVGALAAAVALAVPGAAAAAPVTPPDMRIRVPTDLISIGADPNTGHRDLRFTHLTADVGGGPFELDPTYDAATGTASFRQAIYNSPSPGVWRFDHYVPVAAPGVWMPPSDYEFPLTRFTLNRIATGGRLGAVVATSPKRDYCITGDYRLSGIAHTPDQTYIPQGNCTDPRAALGWSVGWADEYDQTDAGQPIDLTGVPDGTYVLHAVVDPLHVLTVADPAHEVTDTTLRIRGYAVTVLSQSSPGSPPVIVGPPPPVRVSIVNPTSGEIVSGTVPVAVRMQGRPVVRFLLDGRPLGRVLRRAPYAIRWNTRRARRGVHVLAVLAGGRVLARVVVTVENPPPPMTCFVLQAHARARGTGSAAAPPFHTAAPDEVLVAFVSADGPAGGAQSAVVSGAGLRWTLVARADALPGDAEIWTAAAPRVLTAARVTARLSAPGYSEQLSVIAVEGSDGIGAVATGSSAVRAPSVSLRTRSAASLVFAVGHDYDHAVARTLPRGWVSLDQWVDAGVGDTFWVQYTNATTGARGSLVRAGDRAPTGDQWNFAAVELRGGG